MKTKMTSKERKREIAQSVTKTPKGVRLDLRIYLYPDGKGAIHAPGVEHAAYARNDLRLAAQFIDVLGMVKR